MTVETDLRPKARAGSGPRTPRPVRRVPLPRVLGPVLLALVLALAAGLGVLVAGQLSSPPPPARVVTQSAPAGDDDRGIARQAPNANEREGRVPSVAARVPTANEREGRVPTTAARLPNANEREGRVPGRR